MNDINEYIASGILEMYILGNTSDEETREVELMADLHPEINAELVTIADTMADYAFGHAIPPKATVKSLLLATMDYLTRRQQGEPLAHPPVLTPDSRIADFAPWLGRPDMLHPSGAEEVSIKIISATQTNTTAIAWIKDSTDEESHDDLYERFLIVEGTCVVLVGAETHHLGPGDYYEVPLHTPHVIKVTSAVPCKAIIQRVAA